MSNIKSIYYLFVTLFLVASFDAFTQLDQESLRARFAQIRSEYAQQGRSWQRVADIRAPRFIDPSTWSRERERNSDIWTIYDPAPLTWARWEQGAALVLQRAIDDRLLRLGQLPEIDFFQQLHEVSMLGLVTYAGEFRRGGAAGRFLRQRSALNAHKRQQLAAVIESVFSPLTEENLIWWEPKVCQENLPRRLQRRSHDLNYTDWPSLENSETDIEAQCGVLHYPPADKIMPLLNAGLARAEQIQDPFEQAAYLQRLIVFVHPFGDGNGRIARFGMDYVLLKANLPAPVLENMDDDFFRSDWAQAIREGVQESLNRLDYCLSHIAETECRRVEWYSPLQREQFQDFLESDQLPY